MATIREVAKLAGVSIATVSRVLNKKGYVSEETVKQVEHAVKELQYKVHVSHKGQSTDPSMLLAFLVDDVSSSNFLPLLTAMEQTAYEQGFEILVCNMNHRKGIEEILRHNIAGMLLTAQAYERLGGIEEVSFSIPYIVVEEQHNGVYEGAKLATKFLLAHGARFLAFIKGPEIRSLNERFEAFLDVVEEEQIPYRIIESGLSIVQGELATRKLLQHAPFIDAIFACNDEVAMGALRAAYRLRIRVPEKLQVIGFGDSKEGEMIFPALSTVQTNQEENTGKAAVTSLILKIKNSPSSVVIPPPTYQIIGRESTR